MKRFFSSSRLIGQCIISLNDVMRLGIIKRRAIQLTNSQGVRLETVKF